MVLRYVCYFNLLWLHSRPSGLESCENYQEFPYVIMAASCLLRMSTQNLIFQLSSFSTAAYFWNTRRSWDWQMKNRIILSCFHCHWEFPAGLTNNGHTLSIIVERFAIRRWCWHEYISCLTFSYKSTTKCGEGWRYLKNSLFLSIGLWPDGLGSVKKVTWESDRDVTLPPCWQWGD